MSEIIIKEVSPFSLRVGNKIVRKSGAEWQEVTELTGKEREALANYLITNEVI
jgi:hypothetical protein